MRARDLLIVAAVVVLIGFAAFDAIRGDRRDDRSATPIRSIPTATTENVATEPIPPEPEPLPRGVLEGSLLFAEIARPEGPLACPLRLVFLRTGEERRFPQDTLGCSVSAPRTGRAVAKSIGDEPGPHNEIRYRIIDPDHAERPFQEVFARDARLAWSLDGRRVLWCEPVARGSEFELGRTLRRFGRCADGYTDGGDRFYLRGPRLFIGERLVLERPASIDEAVWAANGSVAVIVGGRRLERWRGGHLGAAVVLPEGFAHSLTYFSPDNCAAAVLGRDVSLVDLGCFRRRDAARDRAPECELQMPAVVSCYPWTRPSSFFGHNFELAAWSPDGTWIAVIEADAIVFHRVVGQYDSVRWEVQAATLAWR